MLLGKQTSAVFTSFSLFVLLDFTAIFSFDSGRDLQFFTRVLRQAERRQKKTNSKEKKNTLAVNRAPQNYTRLNIVIRGIQTKPKGAAAALMIFFGGGLMKQFEPKIEDGAGMRHDGLTANEVRAFVGMNDL